MVTIWLVSHPCATEGLAFGIAYYAICWFLKRLQANKKMYKLINKLIQYQTNMHSTDQWYLHDYASLILLFTEQMM